LKPILSNALICLFPHRKLTFFSPNHLSQNNLKLVGRGFGLISEFNA